MGFWKKDYWHINALSIDQSGSVTGRYFLNWLFLEKGGFLFGKPDITISNIIGINFILGKLNNRGLLMFHFLNFLDSEHCFKFIKLHEIRDLEIRQKIELYLHKKNGRTKQRQ